MRSQHQTHDCYSTFINTSLISFSWLDAGETAAQRKTSATRTIKRVSQFEVRQGFPTASTVTASCKMHQFGFARGRVADALLSAFVSGEQQHHVHSLICFCAKDFQKVMTVGCRSLCTRLLHRCTFATDLMPTRCPNVSLRAVHRRTKTPACREGALTDEGNCSGDEGTVTLNSSFIIGIDVSLAVSARDRMKVLPVCCCLFSPSCPSV